MTNAMLAIFAIFDILIAGVAQEAVTVNLYLTLDIQGI